MPVTDTTTTEPRDDDQTDGQQKSDYDTGQRQIHGLLVSYQDDQINECVRSALRGKKRVHYKCLDSISNLLALGTSVGAIYLFRLTNVTHSACKLALVIPCDQGPIEVIKFLPSDHTNGLLVAIGTARGSIVIFQLEFNQTQSISAQEIYRAEKLTKSETIGIKFIQPDQDLLDPCQPYTKLYICDQKCRIFVLDSNSIYPSFPLLYNNKPTPVLDVLESEIHQIFVHRSSLLLSTDERTQVFKEYSTRPDPIGKTKRKRGFYGACFFNANYKPARLQQQPSNRIAASQQTIYSSTASLADLDNLVIFVARPKFSLWQVNYKRQVLFTHKFESPIKSTPPARIVPLHNVPLSEVDDENSDENENIGDKPEVIAECFEYRSDRIDHQIKVDHFEMLLPIFSSTLGNLLLSYTRHEIFIMDPTSARLILWHPYEKAIHQICCNENEIFVLFESGKRSFQVERIVLLAPTQFVLELHRLNRRLSLMAFINLFGEQFRLLMALPLSGPGTLTTEGGLLRNIVWSTWRESTEQQDSDESFVLPYESFKSLVDEIIDESAQMKRTIANPTDSQILLTASNDNIERLFMEPYASMVSLDISIANLHTNHVVHFSQEALNRQQSLAKLSQSILNLSQLRRSGSTRLSLLNLGQKDHENDDQANANSQHAGMELDPNSRFYDKKVSVEPLISRRKSKQPEIVAETVAQGADLGEVDEALDERDSDVDDLAAKEDKETEKTDDYLGGTVCPKCRWPRPRAHLKPMRPDQQIQLSWLQENLLPNFEENIEQIEKCAFQAGLWHLVLRCLAFRNQLDEYIICCIMLDDVRLLNMERFVVIKRSEGEFVNLVFKQLEHKLDFHDEINNRTAHSSLSSESDDKQTYLKDLSTACLKCRHVCETAERSHQDNSSNRSDGEVPKSDLNQSEPDSEVNGEEDDISFNLVNLFKRIMLRRSADIKRAVETLLLYSKLLERSRIPASFYLQMLGNQCSVLRRTRLKVV